LKEGEGRRLSSSSSSFYERVDKISRGICEMSLDISVSFSCFMEQQIKNSCLEIAVDVLRFFIPRRISGN
jgi:hypothetical protein